MSQRFAKIVIGALMSLVAGAGLSLAAAQNGGAEHQKLTFDGDTALWTVAVKPDKTADFETAMGRVKEALMKSEKPERKQQGAGLKLFKAVASPQGQIYVLLADPSVKDVDYSVASILTDGLPAEARAIYDVYAASLATQPQVVIPLDLVSNFAK